MRKLIKSIFITALVAAHIISACSSALAIERVSVRPSTTQQKAPKSNIFQVKGTSDKFILLDETEEGFFVLSLKNYASKPFSKDGTPVPYDPKNEKSIAHWLNNDFLTDGYLPQAILDNLVEKVYTTEGGGAEVEFSKAYDVTCKVVLLSQTEWSKYNAKFGYADDTSSGFWALRTVRERTGSILVAGTSSPNHGVTVDGKWGRALGIRPAFFLSKDFFEKVNMDIQNTGDAVMSLIRSNNSADVLDQIYTQAEMYTLTEADIPPSADGVFVSGRGIVGEKITGSYNFISLDGNTEDGTMIQWQRSRDKEVWSTILGAEEKDYVPSKSDVGYYVRMKVSPMTGSMAGASYVSTPLEFVIRDISKPVASDVRIVCEGGVKPGTILDAKYSFNDSNHDICSGTDYVWEVSADKTIVETKGTSRYYKLSNEDCGKYVRVGVVPKKRTNSADERKVVEGEKVYSEWVKIENLPIINDITLSRNLDLSVNISKTENLISLNSIVAPVNNATADKVTAQYTIEESNDYTVVCTWQAAETENGIYSYVATGANSISIAPAKPMWIRAKVYTKNAENVGAVSYSEPILVGTEKTAEDIGAFEVTQTLTSGKTYQVKILSSAGSISAFSMKMGADVANITSEKYIIEKLQQADGNYLIGAFTGGNFEGDSYITVCEITPDQNVTLTISDVVASYASALPAKAKVLVVER